MRRTLLRFALGAGLLVALQLTIAGVRGWMSPAHPPAAPVRTGPMMPANGGPIAELAIQFHAPGSDAILDVYGELLRAIDSSTRVLVVVGDDHDRRVFETARQGWFPHGGGPRAVRYVSANHPITSWIHDRLVVLDPATAGGPRTLIAPPSPLAGSTERVNDWTVPWLLRAHLGDEARVRAAPFTFDGGDLIADEDTVFVTTRLLGENPTLGGAARVVRQVQRTVGRDVVMLGTPEHPAPDHHVGMFVLPIGHRRVLVGDPDLALALLRGSGDASTSLTVGGLPFTPATDDASLGRFRTVARMLADRGYAITRLPVLPAATDPHAYVSYDNALLERRSDGVMHVYMPVYGIDALDRAATRTYESLGIAVHPIHVERIFRMGGTLGCLVAPIARGSRPSSDAPVLAPAHAGW